MREVSLRETRGARFYALPTAGESENRHLVLEQESLLRARALSTCVAMLERFGCQAIVKEFLDLCDEDMLNRCRLELRESYGDRQSYGCASATTDEGEADGDGTDGNDADV